MSFEAEQAAIARRQKIAEQMMAQGQQPLDTNEMAGGYVVPVSPLAGLGKIAQQLAGAYIGKQADQQTADLADKKSAIIQQLYANGEVPSLDKVAATGLATPDTLFAMGHEISKSKREHDLKLQDVQMNQAFIDEQRRVAAAERSAERAADREARFQQQQDMARLAASLRPAPQPRQDPLVQVMAQDGQPMYVPSSQAAGATPYVQANAKDTKAQDAKEEAKNTVSSTIAALRDQYNSLKTNGGITDTTKGALENASRGFSSSGFGQALGKLGGTENQSIRNTIAQTRPILLQQIMKATGMNAKQMDSNAELKLYLSTATDPALDYQTNIRALENLENLYGIGKTDAAPEEKKKQPSFSNW
jgi:hypothetical protein